MRVRHPFTEIKKKIFSTGEFQQLTELDPTPLSPVYFRGVSGSLWAFIAAYLFEEYDGQVIVVVAEKDFAERLRDDCVQLVPGANVRLYAKEPVHIGQALDMSSTISQAETLKALSGKNSGIYITHATALVFGVLSRDRFASSVIELRVHTDTNFSDLISNLAERGFERKQIVETYGDFAVRGGIVDVFPFAGENPVRLEFWGDTIESMREFDVLSQRSIRELQIANIVPDITGVRTDNASTASLAEYFSPDAILLSEDFSLLEKEVQDLKADGVETDFSFEATSRALKNFRSFTHSVVQTLGTQPQIAFRSLPQPPVNGSVEILLQQIAKMSDGGLLFIIGSDTEEESQRIRELIEEASAGPDDLPWLAGGSEFSEAVAVTDRALRLTAPNIEFSPETLHSGFIFPSAGIAFLTEHEIFGRLKRRGAAKRRRFKGISPKELHALRRGDYVVHVDHGIGRFLGLQKISVGGTEQEVAKIEYDAGGILFVNLNYINRVQKYSSAEGHTPKLNVLGGGEWEKLKTRAKKKIKDIARDLILLYAKRKKESGTGFSPDSHWQKEMEASFLYDDTSDQAAATVEVKADMESTNPMDRLICGDVGFGKTEIAVRAAFKAVQDSKQVAVLVPTTILVEQHLSTFSDRLGNYPIRIAALSRFKSPKQQKAVIAGLKEGAVDIVIGTHRLLSKDIVFKDLGLLVIDEEQRFGVAAKERLRKLRTNVDTLTLTATPIPRTLHFSLLGARDLSIINTPPRNRLPIYTEIAQFDRKLIREAILRELHRGGQVYVVNDRVETIDSFATSLHTAIPEARISVAHGQLKAHELEKVMVNFLEKRSDVLVATKIIESGLDIPNVNTIIINRADRFGLAELYQLRGRVGRSNIQAYAYLLVPPIAALPKATLRRLQAVEEFTELGSGFNLAMRDLEIRGAGNLLGGEQSGFILEMGFEMYTKTLEEAVRELKDQEFSELFAEERRKQPSARKDTVIEADIDAYIPEFYVDDDSERLDIYRRLYRAETVETVDEIRVELEDRFGPMMEEVDHLFILSTLRVLAGSAGFRKIELSKRTVRFHLPDQTEKEFYEGGAFQSIMTMVEKGKSAKIQLKQEGESLFLQGTLEGDSGAERTLQAQELLKLFCG